MSKNKKIVLTAVLLAMQIILSRFLSVKTPIIKISFAFVPSMLCAIWLGPKWTVLLNVLADVIGATLFPTGPYFVGYTISTAISGLIYGLLIYKKDAESFSDKVFIIRVIIAVLLVNFIVNLGLNTLWTSITSGKAFKAIFVTRFIKQVIMIPINILVITFIERILRKPFDTYIRSNDD